MLLVWPAITTRKNGDGDTPLSGNRTEPGWLQPSISTGVVTVGSGDASTIGAKFGVKSK